MVGQLCSDGHVQRGDVSCESRQHHPGLHASPKHAMHCDSGALCSEGHCVALPAFHLHKVKFWLLKCFHVHIRTDMTAEKCKNSHHLFPVLRNDYYMYRVL